MTDVPTAARVLVVDDLEDMRDMLGRIIRRAGHEPAYAADGMEALEQIRVLPPDLVLLDVDMPKLGGLDVLDEMVADAELRTIPVILLTGHRSGEEIAAGLKRGAHDYLTKPFERDELVARMGAALRTRQLVRQLERRNADLESFATIAAHDLKSPLTIIGGAASLINARWEALSPELRAEQFQAIANGVQRAATMIDDLLALARFDSADLSHGMARCDARAVAQAAIEAAPLKDGDSVRIEGEWSDVAVPEPDFATVLGNLVTNACYYGRGADGRLDARITAQPARPLMVIDVADLGPGIPEDERETIFEPFRRGAHSRSVNPISTGVGLAIVRRAARRWGGNVEVHPGDRGGTCFRVTVPLAQ